RGRAAARGRLGAVTRAGGGCVGGGDRRRAALVPSRTPTHPRGAHASGANVTDPCRVRAGSGPIDPPCRSGPSERGSALDQGRPEAVRTPVRPGRSARVVGASPHGAPRR